MWIAVLKILLQMESHVIRSSTSAIPHSMKIGSTTSYSFNVFLSCYTNLNVSVSIHALKDVAMYSIQFYDFNIN